MVRQVSWGDCNLRERTEHLHAVHHVPANTANSHPCGSECESPYFCLKSKRRGPGCREKCKFPFFWNLFPRWRDSYIDR